MKIYAILALGAVVTLGFAAVWMGGLNQDEGWYLYAANLVSEGRVPYRDFFYTQGPALPLVYSAFTSIWRFWGLLGARVFTLTVGLFSILFAIGFARRLVSVERRNAVSLVVLFLLGVNLYHLYYLAIPKTYALASLFVMVGFYLLAVAEMRRPLLVATAGLSLAFAAGTRISLGAILAVVGLGLLVDAIRGAGERRRMAWWCVVAFALGGLAGLAVIYGPFLLDPAARKGLVAAQAYHAARGGSDIVWTVGSFSRLIRWYMPIFSILGVLIVCWRRLSSSNLVILLSFMAVFAVQMVAPFPYEDYQVPVMGLLAVFAAVKFMEIPMGEGSCRLHVPFVMFICCLTSFGSPLLEQWSVNGQDRFWSLKKDRTELSQLQDVARQVEQLDPNGTTLLTQDLYLAIEANRRVPDGLEMGPFAMKSDAEWREFLSRVDCPVAALSGYSFAIEPPSCTERPIGQQMDYWDILKRRYSFVGREENFGQNHTPLLILRRAATENR